MKIISSKFHGVLDYLTVVFLFASPALFAMEGPLVTFTYVLGGIHLLLTVLTDFELGLFKVIPFKVHGLIEIAVAVILTAVAFWFNSIGSELGFYFCIGLAIVILIVFILTNFKKSSNNEMAVS